MYPVCQFYILISYLKLWFLYFLNEVLHWTHFSSYRLNCKAYVVIQKEKRRCAIIIFFILIRYILLIDRFLIEMVYTLYHLLLNWGKPRRNYLLNINNLSIPQMFWYDIHFIFSNKIFKKYEKDEILPYSIINYPKRLAHYTNDEPILALFFEKKCRNFMVSSI